MPRRLISSCLQLYAIVSKGTFLFALKGNILIYAWSFTIEDILVSMPRWQQKGSKKCHCTDVLVTLM